MGFMNFISNVLDAIPGVGHVKAVGHFLVGDRDGASKALYQSSRTSAVLAGGAIGSTAGPIGSACNAINLALLTDKMASYFSGENQGILKDMDNIKNDINHERSINQSLFITGMHLFFDAIGGIGMSGVSSAAVENIGLNLASNADEIVEKSVEELARQIVVRRTVSVSARTTVVRGVGHTALTATRKVVIANANALAVRAVKEVAETAAESALQTSLALVTTHVASRGITSKIHREDEGRDNPEDDGRDNPEDDGRDNPEDDGREDPENIANTDENPNSLLYDCGVISEIPLEEDLKYKLVKEGYLIYTPS